MPFQKATINDESHVHVWFVFGKSHVEICNRNLVLCTRSHMLQARGEGLIKSSAYKSYESYVICLESWQNLICDNKYKLYYTTCMQGFYQTFLSRLQWVGLARETPDKYELYHNSLIPDHTLLHVIMFWVTIQYALSWWLAAITVSCVP